MSQPEQTANLQSVTDSLSGQKLQLCTAGEETGVVSSAEADQLRSVWEMMDILNPPEPDDALLDRIYRQVMTRAAAEEFDDDEFDLAVGAAKSPEIEPADFSKER